MVRNTTMAHNSKDEARRFIEAGGRCIYRYGWAYRGAMARELKNADAMQMLDKYSFGNGFYQLGWMTDRKNGQTVLEFNELSENDMW